MIEQQIIDLMTQEQTVISEFGRLLDLENNIGCVDGKIIGTGRSDYTQGSTIYNLSIGEKSFALIDIPGIEGDESSFESVIQESLDKAHAIFYVNGSGKKIEKATLEKIKKYMRDGTSVYAIFNVHCKAKKERLPGIDKTFFEELEYAYLRQDEIIEQTEAELKAFLGNNYKGSISLNGLLSFCGLAVDSNGNTTIVDEKDKSLRVDQQKYLREYSYKARDLVRDGHIAIVQDTIAAKVNNVESYIYEENIKKLRSRLQKMQTKVEKLNTAESSKIRGFIQIYNEFESNCYNAKEDFIQAIRHVGYNAASDAFLDVKSDLFKMVETEKGKATTADIQGYFDAHKDQIVRSIQEKINKKMAQAEQDYAEAIKDAQDRLVKDFEREQTEFEISLSAENLSLDDILGNALKYSWKSFGNDAFRVGSLALSGMGIGSLIAPGIGTIICAAIGAFIGILCSIWNFFATEGSRVNKAKEKIERAINEQIDVVSDEIKAEMDKLDFEQRINASYDQIYEQAEKQKAALSQIERVLRVVSDELGRKSRKVS